MAGPLKDIISMSQWYWERLRLGSCPLTMTGIFWDIFSMSQWYWDRIRLEFWLSYYDWDVKGYSQNLPMVLGPIKTRIWPYYHGWDIEGYSQFVQMVLGPIKTGIVAVLL